jgi:hypothetical protein
MSFDGKYREVPPWDREAVRQALHDDDPQHLLHAVLAVSLHDPDRCYAQDLCVELSAHSHFHVRGNAILGFGHIARRFGYLDREIVQPIIQASLLDEVEYVRGQAIATMDDTTFLLGWDGYGPRS